MKVLNTDKIRTTSKYTGPNATRKYKYKGKWVTDHHYGVDIVGNDEILAHSSGVVTKVVPTGVNDGTCCKVRIQHKDYQSAYYHLKSGSILVKKGDWVKEGQRIATMGNTGHSTAKHLHFQIDKGGNSTSIDPTDYAYGKKKLEPLGNFEVGNYEVLYNKYYRRSPEVINGKNNNKWPYSKLTPNAKKQSYADKNGYARYNVGAKINIKEFKTDKKGNVWGRTNQLWLCVYDRTGHQVRKI